MSSFRPIDCRNMRFGARRGSISVLRRGLASLGWWRADMMMMGAWGRLRTSTAVETGAMFATATSELQGWSVAVSRGRLVRGGIGSFRGLWGVCTTVNWAVSK